VNIRLFDDNDEAFEFAFEAFYLPDMTTDGILSPNSFYGYDFILTETYMILTNDKMSKKFKINQDSETHLKHIEVAYLCKHESNLRKAIDLHEKLGHYNTRYIERAINFGHIDGAELPDNFVNNLKDVYCDTCLQSNNRRLDHQSSLGIRASSPFEIIHMDIVYGPDFSAKMQEIRKKDPTRQDKFWTELRIDLPIHTITPGVQDTNEQFRNQNQFTRKLPQYMLILVDDFTRYVWVIPCMDRTMSRQLFKNWSMETKSLVLSARARNKLSTDCDNIRILHSDQDKTFWTEDMKKWCLTHKILPEITDANHPYHNAVVERCIGTLKVTTRRLLIESRLPPCFWTYAIKHAAHLRNIVGTIVQGKFMCPHKLLFGEAFKFKNLYKFGSSAYILQQNISKFDIHPRDYCIFLGYERSIDEPYVKCILFQPYKKEIIERHMVIGKIVVTHEVLVCNHTPIQLMEGDLKLTGKRDPYSIEELLESWVNQSEISIEEIIDNFDEKLPSNTSESAADITRLDDHKGPTDNISDENPLRTENSPQNHTSNENLAYMIKHVMKQDFDPSKIKREISDIPFNEWIEPMNKEIQGIEEKGNWKPVDLPPGRKPIDLRWVYSVRDDGSLKARLVVRGFKQTKGVDYFETFSEVVGMHTIRFMISMAASKGWDIYIIDYSQAYLQSDIGGDIIYVNPPVTHPRSDGKVYQLLKAMYGTKQGARCWYKHLVKTLNENFDLHQSDKDSCTFYQYDNNKEITLILLILVDDTLCLGEEWCINAFYEKVKTLLKTSQFEKVKSFNGIEIDCIEKHVIELNQTYAIRVFIETFDEEIKEWSSPEQNNTVWVLCDDENPNRCSEIQTSEFRHIVGVLAYFANCTRPDISHAVSGAQRVQSKPTHSQFKQLLRIVGYLKRNPDMPLRYDGRNYKSTFNFTTFSDSDWGGQPMSQDAKDDNSRKSTLGYCIYNNGGLISWKSKLMKSVVLSATEAEYVAMTEAMKELCFFVYFVEQLGYKIRLTPLFCDNTSANLQVMSNTSMKGTRHTEIFYSWIKEQYKKGIIRPFQIDTSNNVADIFTKSLPGKSIDDFIKVRDSLIHVPDLKRLESAGFIMDDSIRSYDEFCSLRSQSEP